MRKSILPMMLFLLPIILMGSVFDVNHNLAFDANMAFNRAWRLQEQVSSFKESGAWVPSTRTVPYYNSNNAARMDSLYVDYWDPDMGQWISGGMKAYFSYNAAGRVTSTTTYLDYFGMLIPMMKQTSSYDAQNRITHMYMYGGDFENIGNWIPQSRFHVIYGAGTTFEIYTWEEYEEDPRIVDYSRSTFTYDTHGRISEELGYAAPDSTNWALQDQTQYQYHPQDTSTGADFIEFMSIGLSQILINEGFEFPGHVTMENSLYWDGSAWVPDSRTSSEYDTQLKLVNRLEEYYSNSMWEPDSKMLYYYEVNGQPDYTVTQYYNGLEFEDDERTDYTWEDYTSATDDHITPMAELKIRAYPSPFTEELTIQTRSASKAPLKISIHNLRGQTVQSFSATEGQDIRWDGNFADGRKAPAGIYFIRAQQNGSTATTKTMRLR